MTNISVISACNNNCSYCFQKDYHEQGQLMPLDEVKKIVDWMHEDRVGILGGEPTLHPDIVEMMDYVVRTKQEGLLFTNLLTKTSIIDDLIHLPNLKWLINSNSRPELVNLFYKNLDFLKDNTRLLKDNNQTISIGVTVVGNLEEDIDFIDKQMYVLKNYPEIVFTARIGLSTDFHKGNCDIKDFSDSIEYFLDELAKVNPNLFFNFDCGLNLCNIKPKVLARLMKMKNALFHFGCISPAMDVLIDGSVCYCFCCPDDFHIRIDNYSEFKNSIDCRRWFETKGAEYMERNGGLCHKLYPDKKCRLCYTSCVASNEYIRRKLNIPLK